MRLSLVLVVSLALVASGCSALSDSMTPEQKFKSQLNDMTDSRYHVVYDVEANMGGLGGMISGAVNQPEIYNSGSQSKFVVGVSGVTFAAYDLFSNNTAYCTQGSLFGGLGLTSGESSGTEEEDKVTCERVQSENMTFSKKKLDEGLEEFNISLEGTETIADRQCNLYRLTPQEEVNSSSLGQQASNYDDGRINICLDSQKGYPALISIEANQSSELRSDGGLKELVRIEAESYNTEMSQTMSVPVDISASLTCEPFQAEITTFDYSGDVKISVNGEENVTRQVEARSMEKFSLDNESMSSGTNRIEVFTDSGEKRTDSCYELGGFGDYPEPDFNYTG